MIGISTHTAAVGYFFPCNAAPWLSRWEDVQAAAARQAQISEEMPLFIKHKIRGCYLQRRSAGSETETRTNDM